MNCPFCEHVVPLDPAALEGQTRPAPIRCESCGRNVELVWALPEMALRLVRPGPVLKALPRSAGGQPTGSPLRHCPFCGGSVLAHAQKCRHCRRWLCRTCPGCGGSVPSEASVCPTCGQRHLGIQVASPGLGPPGEAPGNHLTDPCRIYRGRPVRPVDFVGHLLSLQEKILLLDLRMGNRSVPINIESHLRHFAREHGDFPIVVRVNQYAPSGEFHLLVANQRIWSFLRLVYGTWHLIVYTLAPWRLFGGDCYQPLTNTVHLFSGHLGVALHEMGHAADFARRRYPGLYMVARILPPVTLYQEYVASRYAVRYLRSIGDVTAEQEAYKVLAPAFFTYLFGTIVPARLQAFIFLPFILLGHAIGRMLSRRVGGPARSDTAQRISNQFAEIP